MADMTFYTHPQSRGRIVRWMLEEVEADYDVEVLHYGSTMGEPDYLAINPMGKVPTIVHGERTVTECAAICAYLADVYPQSQLAPAPQDRHDYYRWLFFTAGPVEAAITNHSFGVTFPKEKERSVGYGNYERVTEVLAQALERNDFIAGPQFTAADVYVGSQVGWGLLFGTLPKHPNFQRYWERLQDRPALKRANTKDDELAASLEAKSKNST